MATIMLMEWAGVTQSQYNQTMKNLDLDKNPPDGGIFHVAGFSEGTLRVLDIWKSQQAYEQFQRDRIIPAAQKAGIGGQPKVLLYPAHNIYAPETETLKKVGDSSLPLTA